MPRSDQRQLQGPPGCDSPDALPRRGVVSDAREQPAQLDRGGPFAAVVEGGADGGGFSLGDGEHAGSMGRQATGGKLGLASTPGLEDGTLKAAPMLADIVVN